MGTRATTPQSATTTAEDLLKSNPDRRHSTPSAQERREARLLAELAALGYSVSVPCVICRHPLTTARSLAIRIGPTCLARARRMAVAS